MALGGIVRGTRTTLRTPTEGDLPAIARWVADMRVRHATRAWHEPAMPATWKERLTEQTKDKSNVLWGIEVDGTLVGMTIVSWGWEPRRDTSHVEHFVIDPDEWHKGYGSDAALALHRYLFDYLDLRRVALDMHGDNAYARRIADRLGYVEYARGHEAHFRDGSYTDSVQLLMERAVWDERWGAAHREYAPLGGRG